MELLLYSNQSLRVAVEQQILLYNGKNNKIKGRNKDQETV